MNEFIAHLAEKVHNVTLLKNSTIIVDNKEFHFDIYPQDNKTFLLKIEEKFYEAVVQKIEDEKVILTINGKRFEFEIRTTLQEKAKKLLEAKSTGEHTIEVGAPMPGMILKIVKKEGAEVEAGEPVIILEAMKMENELRSPVRGKIKEIFATIGEPVEKGIKLFSIES